MFAEYPPFVLFPDALTGTWSRVRSSRPPPPSGRYRLYLSSPLFSLSPPAACVSCPHISSTSSSATECSLSPEHVFMARKRKPCIRIRPTYDGSGGYFSSFTADILDAKFSVIFKKTIIGAIALRTFAEMLRSGYGSTPEFVLVDSFGLPSDSPANDVLCSMTEVPSASLSSALLKFATAPRPCGVVVVSRSRPGARTAPGGSRLPACRLRL